MWKMHVFMWLGKNDKFLLNWLHNFKVKFLSKISFDKAICKWNYRKKLSKLQNYFLRKLFSFPLFLFADSKSSQKQPRDDVLKNRC